MSVIIDLLNKYKKGEGKTEEKLAETYLSTSRKIQPHTYSIKDWRIATAIFLSISILLLLVFSILFIFSTRAMSINITVNKKTVPAYENLIFAQKVSFFGASSGMSHLGRENLVLINEGVKERAGVAIDLEEPVNLSHKLLLISAATKEGAGRLRIILRDKNYRSYISNVIDIKDTWQNFIIAPGRFRDSIDMGNISHIRLEFDSERMREGRSPTIYIKKIALVDT